MVDIFFSGFSEENDVMVPDCVALGYEAAPLKDIGPRKVALFKAVQIRRVIADSLAYCHFLPYSWLQLADLLGAVTGWETSVMELFRIGERVLTLCRLFNTRAGLSQDQDRLPERFFEPTQGGPLARTALNAQDMDRAKRYYYHLMGWDDQGVPMAQKLEERGIDGL